jgi:uncharacterized protein YbaR (Trm112 family)
MSVTYSLVCPETKIRLWVGQRGAGEDIPWLYEGEIAMKQLTDFF